MRLMIVKDVFFYLRIFLPVIFFASSYSFGQNYWLRQNSPTNKDLVKCEFADSLFGWVCGDSGVILHTTDAGASWQTQASGITDYKIEEIFFINRNLGWALSNDYQFRGTDLLTTTNGGINWLVTKFPEPNLVFNTIYFLNSLLGFITGQTGNIFKTTNGGINWIQCMIDSSACPYMLPKIDIHFINAMTGFSCGGAIDYTGVVWKTTNGGENWSALCLTPEPMNVIKPISVNRIVAMGGDPEYGVNAVYSTNNGVSWIYELTPCFGAATGFSLRTPAEGWAVLSYSNVMGLNLDSMKPGTHWQCIPTPEGALLYDIQFTTPTLGWAFGKSGAIFKYNKDIIAVNGNQNNIPNDYVLYQNYPNPFNPVTLIKFEIPKPGFINLTVYDINGREVAVLVNKELKPGTYEAQWDGSTSAGGVYFYRLDAGNSAFPKICRKMVLIK